MYDYQIARIRIRSAVATVRVLGWIIKSFKNKKSCNIVNIINEYEFHSSKNFVKYIVYIDKDNDHEDQNLQNASASLFETFSRIFFFLLQRFDF